MQPFSSSSIFHFKNFFLKKDLIIFKKTFQKVCMNIHLLASFLTCFLIFIVPASKPMQSWVQVLNFLLAQSSHYLVSFETYSI